MSFRFLPRLSRTARRLVFPAAALVTAVACHRSDSDATPPVPSSTTPAQSLLAVGSPLPDVTATAHSGASLNLRALGGKPTVVYFYPKDDTPGCTVEAQEIRDLWNDIQGAGATVIGVSTDGEASHRAFAEKYELP